MLDPVCSGIGDRGPGRDVPPGGASGSCGHRACRSDIHLHTRCRLRRRRTGLVRRARNQDQDRRCGRARDGRDLPAQSAVSGGRGNRCARPARQPIRRPPGNASGGPHCCSICHHDLPLRRIRGRLPYGGMVHLARFRGSVLRSRACRWGCSLGSFLEGPPLLDLASRSREHESLISREACREAVGAAPC